MLGDKRWSTLEKRCFGKRSATSRIGA